jgi:colanic acid biosynthesis glycosyl transferase WcaI
MKILYVSQYFPPEIGAPSARVSELAKLWVKNGHQVSVLTGFPNHPTGKVPKAYRRKLWRLCMTEEFYGARVCRTWLLPLANRKSWERMLNYASFTASAVLRGVFLPKPDVVIATSPQLLVGLAGLCIATFKCAPFVFEVRDLWPESLVAVGAAGESSRLYRVLAKIAKLLYRRAHHIVVVTPAFRDALVRHWDVPTNKISVVMNGVDVTLFTPGPTPIEVRKQFGLHEEFVVSFIGTIGNAHGVNTILEVAKFFSGDTDIKFLLVGEGAEKDNLKLALEKTGLLNVIVADSLPRESIPDLIRACDVCLVLLRKSEVFKTVIPTKMLEFLSCGRPVVLSVEGQASEILQAAEGGYAVQPEHAAALAAAIQALRIRPERAEKLGKNGAQFIRQHLSRDQTALRYLSVLEKVTSTEDEPKSKARSAACSTN